MATKPTRPRIFVQIPSYRDTDCQWTVKDLFEKAKHPERIFVGICWQFDKKEDAACFKIPYPRPEQVRVVNYHYRDAKGASWARAEAGKLRKDEEYTFLIDAHTRFEPGWDEMLITQLEQCDSPKPLLTCYPPPFTPPDKLDRGYTLAMAFNRFERDQANDLPPILRYQSRRVTAADVPEKPYRAATVSNNFLFASSAAFDEVPVDPHIYFFGDDLTLALRLWTHGWDIFAPPVAIAYHLWDRNQRRGHWDDHDSSSPNARTCRRVAHLCGMQTSNDENVLIEIEKYGLGKARTLAEYQLFSGVNFSTLTISEFARSGKPYPRWQAGATFAVHTQTKKHQPRKVFESNQAVVFDDFLPEDVYSRVYEYALKTDYERINTKGKISRAWHIHDGFPLRSLMNLFYYSPQSKKPQGNYVYPTKTALDAFVDYIRSIQPQASPIMGKEDETWEHFSATCWIYPPGTGLAMHDDGSGVYSGAYAYFLNPRWKMHWGGLLIMMDEECNRAVHNFRNTHNQKDFFDRKWLNANRADELMMEHGFGKCILPKRNRMVFIANDAYHMVTRVNEAAGDNVRMSIAGFFNQKKTTGNTGNNGNY